MHYFPQGNREVNTYCFHTQKRETLLRFNGSQGIISHFKLCGGGALPLKLIYVQNSKDIVLYDIQLKIAKLIGTTAGNILAVHIQPTKPSVNQNGDLELTSTNAFLVSLVDDSGSVTIYDAGNLKGKGEPSHKAIIKEVEGIPDTLKDREFFGLGYPYFVTCLNDRVCFSTDFGIMSLSF